jgi:hypothetical protein
MKQRAMKESRTASHDVINPLAKGSDSLAEFTSADMELE